MMWFEFKNSFALKKIMQKDNKQGRIIADGDSCTEYSMVVCASCFYEGSYPLILSGDDFVKKTVIDVLNVE